MNTHCIGAVYCDVELWGGGMIGENVRSGAVIVTKTHELTGFKKTNTGFLGLFKSYVRAYIMNYIR